MCFIQFSARIYWNRNLAASALFPMFKHSVNFYGSYCPILKSTDLWKMWQKWMVTGKFFVSTKEPLFLRGFILKPTETA